MKKSILYLASVAVLVSGVVASSHISSSSEMRIVHLSPGLGSVDVFVNGDRAANYLEFGQFVHLEAGTGNQDIRIVPEGDQSEDELVSGNTTLEEDEFSTLVISDRGFSPGLELIPGETPDGGSKVRVAQFSPDLTDVDVTMENGEEVQFGGLSYKTVSGYHELGSGNYAAVVEDRWENEMLRQEIELEEDTYTLFIAGGGEEELQIVPVHDVPPTDSDMGNGEEDADDEEDDGAVIEETLVVECRIVDE